MSEKINTPQAFPRPASIGISHLTGDEIAIDSQAGMSLRDYFAAKAMQAIISNRKTILAISDKIPEEQHGFDSIAEISYTFAKFMLKERTKP